MTSKEFLTGAGIITAIGLGAANLSRNSVSVPAAPAAVVREQATDIGCSTSTVHESNWSQIHKIDDGPTYQVTICDGKEVNRVRIDAPKDKDEAAQKAAKAAKP